VSDIPLEPPTVKAPGIVPAVEDRSYLGYIAAAMASALAGGFLLAVWMPLAATDTIGPSDRVPWMIQAHGWIQLQGWGGLFVAGMGIRLIPRFAGRKPVPRTVTLPLLAILVVPVALRLVIAPWASGGLADSGAIAIGVSSAAGQLGVATVLAWTLSKGRKPREPWRYFAWAGTAWWAAWALLSLFFIPYGAASPPGYLNALDNDALLWVVMLGPIGNFIWAVQSRSVPVFFGRKTPSVAKTLAPGVLYNAGAALLVVSTADVRSPEDWSGAAFVLAGAALLVLPLLCGSVWGEAKRLRPRAKPAARFVLAANVSAVLAGVLLCSAGLRMLTGDDGSIPVHTRDAARHLFGIGLITMLILGMARLVAPVFALERTEDGVPRALEGAPFWLLLAALVLRAGSALLAEPLGYESRMHTASLAGLLAWLAIAIFAFSVLRAVRAEPRTKRALEDIAHEARQRRAAAK
jgi:hypothetical protein